MISYALSLAGKSVCLFYVVLALALPYPLMAAPIAVRFIEGLTRGYLSLSTVDGTTIAAGDLFQVARNGAVKSRMVFHFKDGSLHDEKVTYTQNEVFAMRTYHLIQRGPAFKDDTEIELLATGTYTVITKSHKDGRTDTINGTLDLPSDVYNGMTLTVVKNLSKGESSTIHMVAFSPKPLLIEMELALSGENKMKVTGLPKSAIHYELKPHPGPLIAFFAAILGRTPQDYHAWVIVDEGVPAFARFVGPLSPSGPQWQIELTSPRWAE